MTPTHDATVRHSFVPADGRPTNAAIESLPRVPARGHYSESARLERLEWLRRETCAILAPLQTTRLAPERLTSNVENLIGAVEVPVGVVGPLLFRGERARGLVYAPFATTEGALVASATRGALAISESHGVWTRVLAQRMTRAPMFELRDTAAAVGFARWLRDQLPALQRVISTVSGHATLLSVDPVVLGATVHAQFSYDTGDAAGQNMTTACTWRACHWIVEHAAYDAGIDVERFLIEGNMSGDKKVGLRTLLGERGTRVVAECLLDAAVVERVLKVMPDELARAYAACVAGATQAGMLGFNVNVANAVAAIFTATGQDIACVHESSIGVLQLEAREHGLFASMTMPALVIGTVGGGTHLPAQQALLDLMGCAGNGGVRRFAEIIAGFALALDLSTLAAIASGDFARAHERLGRNRPVRFLTREDLTPALFEPGVRVAKTSATLHVTAVVDARVPMGSSIVTELTGRRVRKLVGLLPVDVEWRDGARRGCVPMVVKAKPRGEEVLLMMSQMAGMCGEPLASQFERFRDRLGFLGSHDRELAIYQQRDSHFVRHVPHAYFVHRDESREAYVIGLERLSGVEQLDSADDVRGWTDRHLDAAIDGAAALHAIWLGREQDLVAQPWLGHHPTARAMQEMIPLWRALGLHAAREFPALITADQRDQRERLIDTLASWWPALEAMPRTLAHNDFNPRNIALRRDGGRLRLCAYDWELATLRVPQHDLAELLCFVLTTDATPESVERLVERHRMALERESGITLDAGRWWEGYRLSLRDLAINRVPLYLMAHTFRDYGFMQRLHATLWHLLGLAEGWSR